MTSARRGRRKSFHKVLDKLRLQYNEKMRKGVWVVSGESDLSRGNSMYKGLERLKAVQNDFLKVCYKVVGRKKAREISRGSNTKSLTL